MSESFTTLPDNELDAYIIRMEDILTAELTKLQAELKSLNICPSDFMTIIFSLAAKQAVNAIIYVNQCGGGKPNINIDKMMLGILESCKSHYPELFNPNYKKMH